MKSIINLSLLSFLLFALACNNAPAGEEAQTQDGAPIAKAAEPAKGSLEFQVDGQTSKVAWKATKLMGGGHNGFIEISKGNVYVKDGDVVAGSFTLDMSSITNLDLENLEKKADLESHLKSDEFFDVANYPEATFVITEVTPSSQSNNGRQTITGNLTIKGITKTISFFAKVSGSDTYINASTGSFTIDRTQWDVMYGSDAIGTVKDNIINDKVALDITLVAKRN